MTPVWNDTSYRLQEKAMQEYGPKAYQDNLFVQRVQATAMLVLIVVLGVVAYVTIAPLFVR